MWQIFNIQGVTHPHTNKQTEFSDLPREVSGPRKKKKNPPTPPPHPTPTPTLQQGQTG